MAYSVEIRNVAPAPLLVVRRRARPAELSKVVPDGCGTVWNYIRSAGVPSPGRNVAVYRHAGTGQLDVEVGVEVPPGTSGSGEIVLSATPAGTVATVAHFGSYLKLGEANAAIKAFCDANGRAFAGVSWEVYGHMKDPTNVRTDVFYLLKP